VKVVLFCGGLGTRLREHSDTIPKPLVTIGYQPILWYLMKYYAHYGHTDFVVCLGYRGDLIKDFFVDYSPRHAGDFELSRGKIRFQSKATDVPDWNIQFIDTGLHSNIGMRLRAVKPYLEGESVFHANYSDQLSDLPLPEYLARFERSNAIAGFVAVRPSQSYHIATIAEDGSVLGMKAASENDFWINGGYMALRSEIFDYINEGEELVEEPFRRLIEAGRLYSYKYTGFWRAMDTFKDKISFDRMWGQREEPWKVWDERRGGE
jgi:glucose-1-phosphate cytidylyltransferase